MSTRPRSRPEWWTLAVSLVVLVAVVAGLVAEMLAGDDDARPVVTVAAPVAAGGGTYHVPVEVRNEGDRAASSVQVSADLVVDGVSTSGDQTIDFLGAGETESLVFVFPDDPATGTLDVVVSGFAVP